MRLWEICQEIDTLDHAVEDGMYIHPETGELMTFEEALDALQMERSVKLENIALMAENHAIEARALGEKIKSLTERKRTAEAAVARLKGYLMAALVREDGTAEKFTTENVAVTVRKNPPSVVCDDEILPDKYKITTTTISPDKRTLMELLKGGAVIPGAHIEQSRSVIIK